jgi:hypothetical protein
VEILRKSIDGIRVVFQLLTGYIYKQTVTQRVLLNVLLTLLFIAPFNLLGELLGIILPKNEDLYLDNVVLARKEEAPQNAAG